MCLPFFRSLDQVARGFFLLAGPWFYLAGLRKDDSLRITAAFVAITAGVLVHYSAAPYLLVIAAHYGVQVIVGTRWREAFVAAAVSLALVATWIGWSVAHYGTTATFRSNTTVTSSAQWESTGRSTSAKVIGNIVSTIVPHPLRSDAAGTRAHAHGSS